MWLNSRIDVIRLSGDPENLEEGKRMSPAGLHRIDPMVGSRQPGSYPNTHGYRTEGNTSLLSASVFSSMKCEC